MKAWLRCSGGLIVVAFLASLALATIASGASDRSAKGAPIRLGYVVDDWHGFLKLTNRTDMNADQIISGSEREMGALVAWANKTGGVGGRKIIATPYVIDQLAPQDQLAADCQQITQDGHEQVLIDQSIFTYEASWKCFASHKVDYVGIASAADSAFLKSLSPYIVTSFGNVDKQMKAMVQLLQRVHYFNGKLGVVIEDVPELENDYKQVLSKRLSAIGQSPTLEIVDPTDQSTINNAVLSFAAHGVNHVIGFINATEFLELTAQAQAQGFHPRWAWPDYQAIDQVAAQLGNPKEMNGSVAVSAVDGWAGLAHDSSRLSTDWSSPIKPGEDPPADVACRAILSKQLKVNYMNPGQAGASAFETGYCEHFFIWLKAARAVGASWTPAKFAIGLKKLGSFPGARIHELNYSSGTTGGASQFSVGGYVSRCLCYVRSAPWTTVK